MSENTKGLWTVDCFANFIIAHLFAFLLGWICTQAVVCILGQEWHQWSFLIQLTFCELIMPLIWKMKSSVIARFGEYAIHSTYKLPNAYIRGCSDCSLLCWNMYPLLFTSRIVAKMLYIASSSKSSRANTKLK